MADETEKTEPEATEPEAKPAAKKPAAKKAPAKKAEPKAKAAEAEATEAVAEEKPAAKKPAAKKPAAKPEPAAKETPAVNGKVEVRAHAKYVRSSARKARLVCDHIRGKTVDEAFAILAHTPRHVAEDWTKLLKSAVANAEHNHELLGDDLRIAAVKADEGPTLKRFRPRAQGRATKILKRTSHLTITLTPKD